MAVERTAEVARVRAHGPDTRALFLTVTAADPPFHFRAGQFISCLIPTDGPPLNRAYSVASDPADPLHLELLVDRVADGPGSAFLSGLAAGDHLRFTGPWGTFGLEAEVGPEAIFIAEGSTIAPLRPMLHELARRGTTGVELLYGTALGIYRDELAALPGVRLDVVRPEHLLDEARRRFVDGTRDRDRQSYVCGIGAQALALRDLLRGAGYARRSVHYERW